jgi:hypothetical protein
MATTSHMDSTSAVVISFSYAKPMLFWFLKREDADHFMEAAGAQYSLQWRHLADVVNPSNAEYGMLPHGLESACSYLGYGDGFAAITDAMADQLRLLAQGLGGQIVGG